MNRIFYIAFFALGLFFALSNKLEYSFLNFGVALFFDPFNLEEKWKLRPVWQKCWLCSHLFIQFFILFYILKTRL